MSGASGTAIAVVRTDDAPAPIGPYSQAIRVGAFVYCSGQIPLDPATGALAPGGVAAQTERVVDNLAAVLRAAGTDLGAVVKTTVYLLRMSDFAEMNDVYAARFGSAAPARSTVAVAGLPLGARIEIEAVAFAE